MFGCTCKPQRAFLLFNIVFLLNLRRFTESRYFGYTRAYAIPVRDC